MRAVSIKRAFLLFLAGLVLSAGGYYVYVRHITTNFHMVVRGKVYRSAQPTMGELEAWINKYGIKTVVNLGAGITKGADTEESAVAQRTGARVVYIHLPNLKLPEPALLMQLADVLDTAEQPILLHCREGADRTGLASVMAAMAVGGKSYDRAREQMDIRFLHMDNDPTHVGGVLQQYEDYCHSQSSGRGGWKEFRYWLYNAYRDS